MLVRWRNRRRKAQHLFFLSTFNQIADPSEIEKIVDRVIANNPKQLEQYRGGKTKLQGYFAGQVRLSPDL